MASLCFFPYNCTSQKPGGKRAVELDAIFKLVLFGISHWVLAIMLLHDLAGRKRVWGGRKWLWVLIILFITYLGSLLYLLFHPQVLFGSRGGDDDNKKDI